MKKSQYGFSVIEGLLIIIALTLVVFVGYYVWHTQKQTDKTLNTAAQTSQNTTAQSKNVKPNKNSNQKFLVIKEWNVRIPYDGDDTFSYKYEPSGNGTKDSDAIEVISQNLASKYGCTGFGAGIIYRAIGSYVDPTDPTSPTTAQLAAQSPNDWKHVGDYYYRFTHDQAACSDTVTVDAQNQANASVKALIPSIEPGS